MTGHKGKVGEDRFKQFCERWESGIREEQERNAMFAYRTQTNNDFTCRRNEREWTLYRNLTERYRGDITLQDLSDYAKGVEDWMQCHRRSGTSEDSAYMAAEESVYKRLCGEFPELTFR